MLRSIIKIAGLGDLKRKSRLAAILQTETTRQGLRHRDLATLTGIAQSTVSRCLSGDMPISMENSEKFADALGLNKEWVVSVACAEKELKELIEQYADYPSLRDYFEKIQRQVGIL